MSIAVSARVRPSRFFATCALAMALCTGMSGIFAVLEVSGTFSCFSRLSVAAVCFVAAFCFLFLFFGSRQHFLIEISESGRIHLHGYAEKTLLVPDEDGYDLAAGSTAWPFLLLLHLRTSSGRPVFLRIFHDAVTREEFKSLYIASRWLMARNPGDIAFSGTAEKSSGRKTGRDV